MVADSIAVICGPTAAGKSAISLVLAEDVGATIIAADSRQVYRGFDIGTAKPTKAERIVPHRGIDVAEPTETYSAGRWAASASEWIADADGAGSVPIVVGGTGFYIKSLFEPLFEAPPLDAASRSALDRQLATMPVAELRRWCAALDPKRQQLGRAQLTRAVETALLTGSRLSDLHRDYPGQAPVQRAARYLYVDPGDRLQQLIEQRVDSMLVAGWLDEVRELTAVVPADAPAWKASGYRTMRDVVEGRSDLNSARTRVIIETRQYAKRQRTWFRNQLPRERVTTIDPLGESALENAVRWLRDG